MDARPHGGKTLTKYERTQVIGLRAEQLAHGAKPLVDHHLPDDDADASASSGGPALASTLSSLQMCYDLAERELEQHMLPFIVQRRMPDGKTEQIRLSAPSATATTTRPRPRPRPPPPAGADADTETASPPPPPPPPTS
jgi:DNA-directed RNA polymerase subunit K/omega